MMQITFCRPEACAACNACEGGKKEHSIWVRGEGRIGEIAIVDMPGRMVVKASAIAYGLPLLLLLAGMILGNVLRDRRGRGAGSRAGLAAGLVLEADGEEPQGAGGMESGGCGDPGKEATGGGKSAMKRI